MRLSYVVLLVAAITLPASGHALSAATLPDDPTDIPALRSRRSPDLPPSLAVVNGAGDEERFLSKYNVEYDGEDIDEDDDDDEEEERANGANLFKSYKLDEMLSSVKTFKRFARWKHDGWSPTAVYNKLNIANNPRYKDLYSMYNRNYGTI